MYVFTIVDEYGACKYRSEIRSKAGVKAIEKRWTEILAAHPAWNLEITEVEENE